MPDKKRTMNDMVVSKKTVVKKRVLSVPKQIPKQPPKLNIEPQQEFFDDETYQGQIAGYDSDRSRKQVTGCLMWVVAGVCLIALVLGIGGLFTHTKISLTPKHFSGSVDVSATLSQNSNDPNTVFFGAATKVFTEEKIVPSISTAPSESKATGSVQFFNTNTTSRTIPAKTEITSKAGKKYILNTAVTVPAKTSKGPGQMVGAVTAVISGIEGNSGPDDFLFSKTATIFTGVTIRSSAEISGGASTSDAVADPQAIMDTENLLKQKFADSNEFVKRLSEQVPENMIVLPISVPENPVMITLDPKHSDGVHVIASQAVTILMVDRADIANLFGANISVPQSTRVVLRDFGTISAMTSGLVAGQPIPQKLQVRMTGDVALFGWVDTQKIKEGVLGKSRGEVKEFIDQVPEVDEYKINMRPFWRRIVPTNVNEVEVVQNNRP